MRIDEQTRTLIKQVADELGADIENIDDPEAWFFKVSVRPDDSTRVWHESEPVTFGIRPNWDKKGSFHISSSFPSMKGCKPYSAPVNPYRYQEKHVAINVSEKKTPAKIAREIEKRFKDDYMVYYQRALDQVKGHQDATAGTASTVEKLQTASHGLIKPWGSHQEDTRWEGVIDLGDDRVRVKAYNGKVEFEMHYLNESTGLKIAKVLGDLAKEAA